MAIKIMRGSFSTVHIDPDSDMVQIKSEDFAKECMSLGWFPSHRLFPVVEISPVDGFDYQMRKFDIKFKKANLKSSEWNIYKTLRKITATGGYSDLIEAIESIANELPADVVEALQEAVHAMTNYGENMAFEISPRNCAVTEEGNLILLDCFFDMDQLEAIQR